jgi:hypothetical protein
MPKKKPTHDTGEAIDVPPLGLEDIALRLDRDAVEPERAKGIDKSYRKS